MDLKGHAKLCDFGFCKKLKENGKTNSGVGSLEYAAPEIWIDNCEYDYSVDYWSFGICVYFMLTGNEPFKNNLETMNNKMPDLNEKREKKAKKYEISDVACHFVSKLLTKNPEQRLGSKTLGLNIKEDPFFDTIDWIRLENGEINSPIKINVNFFNFFNIYI